jgi:hypothetical protein
MGEPLVMTSLVHGYRFVVGACLSAALLTGCGSSKGDGDGGGRGDSGGGGSGGGGRLTMGEFCSQIGGSFCDRFVSCGLATAAEKPTCVAAFQDGCCAMEGTCSATPADQAADDAIRAFVTACVAALPAASCAQVGQGMVPAACSMLPTAQSSIVMGTLGGFPNPPAMGSDEQARPRPTRSTVTGTLGGFPNPPAPALLPRLVGQSVGRTQRLTATTR